MVSRDEIARLCAEHDRMMAEASEPIRSPPVSETDDAALVYKTTWSEPEPAPEPAPSDDEAYPPLSDLREAIAEFVVEWTNRKLVERDRRIASLEGDIRELKGMLGATLTLLGQKSGNTPVGVKPESALRGLKSGNTPAGVKSKSDLHGQESENSPAGEKSESDLDDRPLHNGGPNVA